VILVDTSVWIRYLSNQSPYAECLDGLLERGEVAGHELICGELLIGDKGGRAKLLANYAKIYQLEMVPHGDVVAFVRHRKLHGRGLGWIDVHLLASTIVGRLQLWTADQSFAAVTRELGVASENS
jgi:predicted nucleic acid-binding protein